MSAFSLKFRKNKQTGAFLLALGLLAFAGIVSFEYATPDGLALNDDSIAYIAGARSILSGQGYREAWLISNEPMTHWPPGFPGVLAFIGWVTGLDPVRGARALNGALFGVNSILMGVLAWRMTRSHLTGLFASTIFLLSTSLLEIHVNAMSEPLYVFLTLLVFLTFERYFANGKNIWLVTTGFIVGLAYLSRYAAISLLATLLVILLIFHPTWKKRVTSIIMLLLSALPLILLWSYRNYSVAGSATNRKLGWHPIIAENWQLGVQTFSNFLMPIARWRAKLAGIPGFFEIIIVVLFLLLLAWVLYAGLPRFFAPHKKPQPAPIPFFNGLYVFGYLSVLITTMTLFDPATKFQVRIISPVYPSLILLLISFIHWLFKKQATIGKLTALAFAIFIFGILAHSQFSYIQYLSRSGLKFASPNWYAAESIAYLRALPEDMVIYTNEAGVVYLYAGRPAMVLPDEESAVQEMRNQAKKGQAVIALFRVNEVAEETVNYYYFVLGHQLYHEDFSRDWIFISTNLK